MRKLILLLVLVGFSNKAFSQVNTRIFDSNRVSKEFPKLKPKLKGIPEKRMMSFDINKLIEEDRQTKGRDVPFRFGKGFDVNLTLKDGKWDNSDSGRIWSLKISSTGAYSLNFIFEDLFLGDGAELYIYNTKGTMVYGPLTSAQNSQNKTFLTDLIEGDSAIIQLLEPTSLMNSSSFRITRIVHGYRNMFSIINESGIGSSGSCNKDITCYSDWTKESDAVALVLLSSGSELCSGSLVGNTAMNFRPFFLSAFHCIDLDESGILSNDEINNAENWMFRFQFKKTTCGGSSVSNYITYNRANYRAAWRSSDFSLMELVNSPIGDSRFTWLGWDRSGNTPSSVVGIHHPSGDVMKYAMDNESPTITTITNTPNSHWYVNNWNVGTTESGSSGSPLFDQNKRVIGQDHAGNNFSACDPNKGTYYGRFSISWTGGAADENRLSNWLDPCNTLALTTNTLRSPFISGPSIVCSSGATFYVNNVPPNTNSIIWTSSFNLIPVSGQGTTEFNVRASGGINPELTKFNNTLEANALEAPSIILPPPSEQPGSSGWIRVTFINSCGDTISLPQKTVWSGLPGFKPVVTGPTEIQCGVWNMYFEQNYRAIYWSVPSSMQIIGPAGPGHKCTIKGLEFAAAGVIGTVSNECGSFSNTLPVMITCGYLAVSPNPASSEIDVSVLSTNEDKSVSQPVTSEKPYVVNIYNTYGTKVLTTQKNSGSFKLSVSNLVNGTYFLEVSDGKNTYKNQLTIKH